MTSISAIARELGLPTVADATPEPQAPTPFAVSQTLVVETVHCTNCNAAHTVSHGLFVEWAFPNSSGKIWKRETLPSRLMLSNLSRSTKQLERRVHGCQDCWQKGRDG